MVDEREQLRFNVLRNAIYHTSRRRKLELINRFFNFFVILLGTAAMTDILSLWHVPIQWTGAGVAIVGALQLVFDFGRAARDHQALQRDYYFLLAEIEKGAATPENIANWSSQMIRIAGDEPPTLRAADAKAYNEALDALGTYDNDQRLSIPIHHRLFADFFPFGGYQYRKLSEVRH